MTRLDISQRIGVHFEESSTSFLAFGKVVHVPRESDSYHRNKTSLKLPGTVVYSRQVKRSLVTMITVTFTWDMHDFTKR